MKTVSTDVEVAKSSIRRMAEMDIDILCVGHGRPIMQNASVNIQALVKRMRL